MPKVYPPEVREQARDLYLRYGGQNLEQIAKDLIKQGWPNFRADRIRDWAKEGGWHLLLAKKLTADIEYGSLTSAQKVYGSILHVRQLLDEEIKTHGIKKPDILKIHQNYAALEISALSRLDAERGSLEGYVAFWEWQLKVAGEISPKALKELVAISQEMLARAQDYFSGKNSETEIR